MPLQLIRADLTKLNLDAVVNAANSRLAPGGGVCGAIFAEAGYEELNRACRAIGGCETGCAVVTDGFQLPARYIIHTVGPIWHGGDCNEESLLRECYRNSLELAKAKNCGSIAFPLISSGIYGYPKEEALKVAVSAIQACLKEQEMTVYLTVFDREIAALGKKLYPELWAEGL